MPRPIQKWKCDWCGGEFTDEESAKTCELSDRILGLLADCNDVCAVYVSSRDASSRNGMTPPSPPDNAQWKQLIEIFKEALTKDEQP
jgi:hypothetical protein